MLRSPAAADIIVEPYPEFLEREANDSYWPAADDGSRPAKYMITLFRFAEIYRSNAEITAFHESYPGHHLQLALAGERPAAHPITRLVGNSGFAEGWARYSEALRRRNGALHIRLRAREPAPVAGSAAWSSIRAFTCSAGRGSRQLRFMAESGPLRARGVRHDGGSHRAVAGAAHRVRHRRAEFFALREQAEKALGDRFDVREFHDVVLGSGTVTLPMLREQVEAWLESKKGSPGAQ